MLSRGVYVLRVMVAHDFQGWAWAAGSDRLRRTTGMASRQAGVPHPLVPCPRRQLPRPALARLRRDSVRLQQQACCRRVSEVRRCGEVTAGVRWLVARSGAR